MITHATRGPRKLVFPRNTPADQQWIYQLALPFQVSPTEAAMAVNIRLGRTPVVDLEVGTDVILFNNLNAIDDSRCLPLNRAFELAHPRTGERVMMSQMPAIPGFIPLGAKRPDGTAHPHAGTGFALASGHGYPVALASTPDTHINLKSDIYSRMCLNQLAYDGQTMRVTDASEYDEDGLLAGHNILFMSMTPAIPSGDDLISGLCTGAFAAWNAGFARWKRGSDGKWKLADYTMTAPDTHEPSLVRDTDGSLLMLFRPWNTNKQPMRLNIKRSTDEGATWRAICEVDNFWQSCPMSLSVALDGTPYVMANRYREPAISRFAKREMIWAWPLSEDRNSLMEPLIVRDATTGFGPPPNGTVWRIDHPVGQTLRLGDGQWRHIITYRGLEDAEMRTDAGATAMTGTYVQEMVSDGPARPTWRF